MNQGNEEVGLVQDFLAWPKNVKVFLRSSASCLKQRICLGSGGVNMYLYCECMEFVIAG